MSIVDNGPVLNGHVRNRHPCCRDLTDRGNGKIEGVAYVEERGSNTAVLAVVNDNDFGLVVPIPEQIDLLAAPALCTAG